MPLGETVFFKIIIKKMVKEEKVWMGLGSVKMGWAGWNETWKRVELENYNLKFSTE